MCPLNQKISTQFDTDGVNKERSIFLNAELFSLACGKTHWQTAFSDGKKRNLLRKGIYVTSTEMPGETTFIQSILNQISDGNGAKMAALS